ncbi:MAG: hypothetical protein PHG82_04710 [Candidatus Gracilibacteria bacterium]|nr:hypothetical protein [Candidatus Gracilibacteria bacterium]
MRSSRESYKNPIPEGEARLQFIAKLTAEDYIQAGKGCIFELPEITRTRMKTDGEILHEKKHTAIKRNRQAKRLVLKRIQSQAIQQNGKINIELVKDIFANNNYLFNYLPSNKAA